ncbi:MAG: serine--tRNA ligase [Gammaproteobacteria bacterium]|nr:serine--tRNA ligase [Gammaproteobacteria bacterium]
MLDIKFIIENQKEIQDIIQKRGVKAELPRLVELYHERKTLKTHIEEKRAEANQVAKQIPSVPASEKPQMIAKGKELNQYISSLEPQLRELEDAFHQAWLTIPNLLSEDTPDGASDADNIPFKHVGTPTKFDFTAKDHLELAALHDWIDFDSGAKVTGSKFYFLKNEAVLMEYALTLFAMQVAREFGYTPLATPDMAKRSVLVGTGFNPRGDEANIYNIEDMDLSLIATAEITVGGMHADTILDDHQLPLKYVAHSHCFRREAGASGRESKGLYRVHQFSKIELFQITTPAQSQEALENILKLEEAIYTRLGLPYRVVKICAGDLGAAAYKKYDIEVWMPGRESDDKYGEVTSSSNCTDFQARRLNIRYRDANNQKYFPHTLNGTAIAISRTLLALMENYQQADGSIKVPDALVQFIGQEIFKPKK